VEWASSLWLKVVQELDPQFQRTVRAGRYTAVKFNAFEEQLQGFLLSHNWPPLVEKVQCLKGCIVWSTLYHKRRMLTPAVHSMACCCWLQVIVTSKFDNRCDGLTAAAVC
jgi:hypothetical protein